MTPLHPVVEQVTERLRERSRESMSGASGRVPAAIHVTPEAKDGGAIARIVDGDPIRIDAVNGRLDVLVDEETFAARTAETFAPGASHVGMGRELFALFRNGAMAADMGAGIL